MKDSHQPLLPRLIHACCTDTLDPEQIHAATQELERALAPALLESCAAVIKPFGREVAKADACAAALVLQLMLRMHIAALGTLRPPTQNHIPEP